MRDNYLNNKPSYKNTGMLSFRTSIPSMCSLSLNKTKKQWAIAAVTAQSQQALVHIMKTKTFANRIYPSSITNKANDANAPLVGRCNVALMSIDDVTVPFKRTHVSGNRRPPASYGCEENVLDGGRNNGPSAVKEHAISVFSKYCRCWVRS